MNLFELHSNPQNLKYFSHSERLLHKVYPSSLLYMPDAELQPILDAIKILLSEHLSEELYDIEANDDNYYQWKVEQGVDEDGFPLYETDYGEYNDDWRKASEYLDEFLGSLSAKKIKAYMREWENSSAKYSFEAVMNSGYGYTLMDITVGKLDAILASYAEDEFGLDSDLYGLNDMIQHSLAVSDNPKIAPSWVK